MAALVSSKVPSRHVLGDVVARVFTLSGTNGDTLTIAGISQIVWVGCTPTTAIDFGATWSGNVVTFITAGAFAGSVVVLSLAG